MFSLLLENPLYFLIVAAVLALSLSLHEFAHAWTADRLGDPTPRSQGRVTLNPLAHLDPLGTLLLLLAGFGWGKPVMFDPFNLKNPRRDTILIAIAGPLSNLVIALLVLLLFPWLPLPLIIWRTVVGLNVTLAVFNLLPIYPLDGSRILAGLLSPRLAMEYEMTMQRYGFIILLLLILPLAGGLSPLDALLGPLQSEIMLILIRIVSTIHGALGL